MICLDVFNDRVSFAMVAVEKRPAVMSFMFRLVYKRFADALVTVWLAYGIGYTELALVS